MTKKKKLAKDALKHPEYFSSGELAYFSLWLRERKDRKQRAKEDAKNVKGRETEP